MLFATFVEEFGVCSRGIRDPSKAHEPMTPIPATSAGYRDHHRPHNSNALRKEGWNAKENNSFKLNNLH